MMCYAFIESDASIFSNQVGAEEIEMELLDYAIHKVNAINLIIGGVRHGDDDVRPLLCERFNIDKW